MKSFTNFGEILRSLLLITIGAILTIAIFIGAILQESYKLCPVTEEEMTEVRE